MLDNDGEDQLDRSCKKKKNYYKESGRKGTPYKENKEGRVAGLVTSCVETVFQNTLSKERWKDESERKTRKKKSGATG
jgi:hypothetical protein